jgi:hypothetical protein
LRCEALGECAANLTLGERRIEDLASVVGRDVAIDTHPWVEQDLKNCELAAPPEASICRSPDRRPTGKLR